MDTHNAIKPVSALPVFEELRSIFEGPQVMTFHKADGSTSWLCVAENSLKNIHLWNDKH